MFSFGRKKEYQKVDWVDQKQEEKEELKTYFGQIRYGRFDVNNNTTGGEMTNGTIYDLEDGILYHFIIYQSGVFGNKKRIKLSINDIDNDNYHNLANTQIIKRKITFEEASEWAMKAIIKLNLLV
jgi:hypothetical protein